MGEPAEAGSVRSMLHIVRILAIIFGILLALGGIAYVGFLVLAYNACNTAVGFANISAPYCGQAIGFVIWPAIVIIILGVVDVLVYFQIRRIEDLVNKRQYEQAKSLTLIWMIIGFVLGAIIPGILLLVAYLKFDPLVNWQRAGYPAVAPPVMMAPVYPMQAYPKQPYPQQPGYGAPPATPPAAPAAAPPAAGVCPRCGRPATYIPQYGRYYCYTDQQYV